MEILFRGKRIDNGEWVYGSLIRMDDEGYQTFIFPPYNYASSQTCGQLVAYGMIAVIPETVGQYTGLKDTNGQMIFDGDVLNHPIQGKRKVYYPFSERVASYGLRMIDGEVRMASTLREGFLYEIIGNIHDNPELLDG